MPLSWKPRIGNLVINLLSVAVKATPRYKIWLQDYLFSFQDTFYAFSNYTTYYLKSVIWTDVVPTFVCAA